MKIAKMNLSALRLYIQDLCVCVAETSVSHHDYAQFGANQGHQKKNKK